VLAWFSLGLGCALRGQSPAIFWAVTARLSSLQKKSLSLEKPIPQRLKPDSSRSSDGPAEAVPFQNCRVFRKL